MSHNQQIIKHLKKKSITPMEALQLYGCFRLAARINDLRKAGHKIETILMQDADRRYAKYKLKN